MNNKDFITEVDLIQEHLKPYSVKSANDFKWIEKIVNHHCEGYSVNKKSVVNMEINANLLKGKGITSNNLNMFLSSMGGDLGVEMNYQKAPNFDILGNIGKSMMGYLRKQHLNPQVMDTGPVEGNERRSFQLQQLQRWLQERIVPNYMEQATMSVFQKHGIQNPTQLSPEEQQEIQFEIQNEFEVMSPSRLEDYMRKDYMSSTTKKLTGLMKYLLREYDIKDVTDGNFGVALATAYEIYYSGIRGDQLVYEPVDPRRFIFGDYDTCKWIQDSMWCRYDQDLPAIEVISRYGTELTSENCNKIAKQGHNYREKGYLENARLISAINDDRELKGINLRSREGRAEFENIKRKYGVNVSTNVTPVSHVVFKSIDNAKFVVRRVDGKKQGFYVSEDYEERPELDIEVKDARIPIVMEGTRIQVGSENIIVEKQPVPYSYRSIENPFKVTLPYIGGVYNKMMGMGEVVSQIDLGKPYQYEYNVVKAKMEEDRATDYGKVLPLLLSLMPDDYELDEWLSSIKNEKIMPIADNAYTDGRINYSELQLLRAIDLSNVDKIASKIQELENIRMNATRAMGYNDTMLGQASPYESVANSQTNINLSLNQTEDIYAFHNKIVEKSLTTLMQNALIYFKDKPIQSSLILDDLSRASLNLDLSDIQFPNVGVFISNSAEDENTLAMIKGRLEPLANAGILDEEAYVRLLSAKSLPEVYNILRGSKRQRDKAQKEQRQHEQAMMKQQQEALLAEKEQEGRQRIMEIDRRNIATLNAAELNAQTLERANDINKNNINDANERQERELTFKREQLSVEDKNRALDRELKKLSIEIDKIKAKSTKKA